MLPLYPKSALYPEASFKFGSITSVTAGGVKSENNTGRNAWVIFAYKLVAPNTYSNPKPNKALLREIFLFSNGTSFPDCKPNLPLPMFSMNSYRTPGVRLNLSVTLN